jgi:hypothetical protein
VPRKDHTFRLVLDQGTIGIVAARVRGEIFHGGEQAAQVERMLPATRPDCLGRDHLAVEHAVDVRAHWADVLGAM